MNKSSETGSTKRRLIVKSNAVVVIAIIVTAVVLSFSVVTFNFLWSLSGHYNRVMSEKAEASSVLKKNVANIESLQANFNVSEAGDVKSDTVLDALPSKYDFPALATTIESLVASSGLVLSSFNGNDLEDGAVQESTTPQPIEIEFSMTVSGSYTDIQRFIDNMDRTIRPMKVTRIELKGSDDNMKASLQIITYYQPSTSLEVETRTIE